MTKPIINLDNKPKEEFKKINLPEDAYEATIKSFKTVVTKKWDKTGTEEKILAEFKIGEDTVTGWFSSTISKGSGTYSNSKLYDLLDKAVLLDSIRGLTNDEALSSVDSLCDFLTTELRDKRVKVLIRNANKGSDNEYSVVGEVIKFL